MADRPILFSAPMVRALLAGTKTQTRRTLKEQPPAECSIHYMLGNENWVPEAGRTPLRHHWEAWGGPLFNERPEGHLCGSFTAKMKFKAGDRLWVREAFQEFLASEFPPGRSFGPRGEFGIPAERAKGNVSYVAYRANGEFPPHPEDGKAVWRSPIFMPRKFSRLTLTVTEVRVQRLQEISRDDAVSEGLIKLPATGRWVIERGDQYLGAASFDPRSTYAQLWDEINGAGAWAANPWVVAYSFTVDRRNIDMEVPHV